MSSKASPLILVRADASPSIGSGHVMRCLALAKGWENVGGRISWLMAESIPGLEERLCRQEISCSRTHSTPGSTSDASQTIAAAQSHDAAWVVIDGYRFSPEYVRTLKESDLRVLFLDDDGRFDYYPADVILNQNVSAKHEMYAHREPSTKLLLGSAYALLRPEFLAAQPDREHVMNGRRILITMGGSDPEIITEKVIRALGATDLELKVVIGAGNPRRDNLTSLARSMSSKIEIEQNPANMAPLMQWADVAISAAGSTCWELAYMGLPAVVIASSSDQRSVADGLAEQGIALNLGWHANLSEEAIHDAAISLLHDHSRRAGMSERGRKLIDGRGAARVAAFLQNSL